MLRARSGPRRALRANHVNDDDDNQNDDDEADDQTDEEPERGAGGRIGCGRGCAIGRVLVSGDGRCAPGILQRIGAIRCGRISAGRKRAVDRDDLRDSIRPRRHRQGSPLVGRRRRSSTRRRRLNFPFDAQGDGSEGQGRTKGLSICGQGLVGACRQDERPRVLKGELGFVLRSGVHELHVADRGIVARHKLDVLVCGAADVRGTCGFAHRARRVDDGQRVNELAILGKNVRLG